MNEQELRRHYRKSIIICSVLVLIIIGIGISALIVINNSRGKIIDEQMEREARDIKSRIVRQIHKDNEALEALSVFMEGYSLDDMEAFGKRFYDAKLANSFVSMAYFGKDGIGVWVNNEEGIKTNIDYHSLGKEMQDIVDAAYEGRSTTSSVFNGAITNDRIIAYAVPLYNENDADIVGVLTATGKLDVFDELAGGEKVLNGNGDVHLVSKNGALLISSYSPDDYKDFQSILYSNYFFDYDTQQAIKRTFEKNDHLFCYMKYEGRTFRVYLHPLGINDWYLMCLHNQEVIKMLSYKRAYFISGIFGCLFLTVILMFIYMMRINFRNTHSLLKIAFEDPLTNADNMARFMKNLNKERNSGEGFSLVAFNVYQFKFINEVLGVDVADSILRYICTCLNKTLQEGEFFCRESNDLFFICLRETDKESVQWRLEHIMREISIKAVPDMKDFIIKMYAGVYICNSKEENKLANEILITRTRFAMQHSHGYDNNKIRFYDADIHKREEMENYAENRMHQALENGEFKLYLQPKINLKTGKLGGAEALVRWITPEGQKIFPDLFIPLFEKNGFCIQLDLYMLEQACKQICEWMDAGVEPVPISVNQSKILFFDSNYVSNLEDIVHKYNVPPSMITLEILESLVLGHVEEMNRKLRRLRDIGFKISMDDFGSGYSSFNSLGNLEIDELKIDRAFLMEVSYQKTDRFKTILSHIIELSKDLNITTVAEGVETTENADLIHSLGCDYGQGYLYSRPVSNKEFNEKYMGIT